MAKSRVGQAPTGNPTHFAKINGKSVGFMEKFVSIKAYGQSIFLNNRHAYESRSLITTVLIPKGVAITAIVARHGAWLEVGRG